MRIPKMKNEKEEQEENLQLEGLNPVKEALLAGKDIDKILIKKGASTNSFNEIYRLAKENAVVIQEVPKEKLDKIRKTNNHQGVIALCPAYDYATVEQILDLAISRGQAPFIIILAGIKDPHNLGAIIRTAECAGAHGIIIPKRNTATINATVNKSAAGSLSHMLVAKVSNIANTIDNLKKQNIWVAAGTMDGDIYFDCDLTGPIALVIGSEGEGIGKLITKKCDFLVKIPMYGKVNSLNASVAAGLLMYEVVRNRAYKF